MDDHTLEYEIQSLNEWGDFSTFVEVRKILMALLERVRKLEAQTEKD